MRPEQAIALQVCARPDEPLAREIDALDQSAWDALLALAGEHRFGPLLHRAAKDCARPERTAALREIAALQTQVSLAQAQVLQRASRTLGDAGIEHVALKGCVLAFALYPEPALRPLRDIDLLTRPDRAEEARETLLSKGFTHWPPAGSYGIDHSHQLPPVFDEASDTAIEIHHRLSATGWPGEPELLDMIWRDTTDLAVFSQAIPAPSAHGNALHLTAHATLHHTFSAGPLVLADLHYLNASGALDWPALMEQARTLGLLRSLGLLAAIARNFGALWVPACLQNAAAEAGPFVEEAAAALIAPREEYEQRQMLRRMEDAGDKHGLAGAAKRAFSPDADQLARIAGTSASDPRRWLAFPAWARHRAARYLAARRNPPALNMALREWLRGQG